MNKQTPCLIGLMLSATLLSSCVGSLWTGASLVYDRHNVYRKWDDYTLAANAAQSLYRDHLFKQPGCVLDIAAFNGDLLLAGHVPNEELRTLAVTRLSTLPYREFFKQIAVDSRPSNSVEDTWITAMIRSQIVADAAIDPNQFKIITIDNVVYVMGQARPAEAALVLNIARQTNGVIRVVKLLRYYNLSKKPSPSG